MTYIPDIYNFSPTDFVLAGLKGNFENLLPGYAGWLEITNTSAWITVFGASDKFNTSVTKYVYPGMRSYLYVDASENANLIYWSSTQALYDTANQAPVIPINGQIKICGYTIETPPVSTTDTFILTNLVNQNYQLNNHEETQFMQNDTSGTLTYVSDTSTTTNFRIIIAMHKPWPGGFITSVAMQVAGKSVDSQFRMMLFDVTGNPIWTSNLHTLYNGSGLTNVQSIQRLNVNTSVGEQDKIYLGMWINKAIAGYEFASFGSSNERIFTDNNTIYGAPITPQGGNAQPPYFQIVYQNKSIFGVI